MIDLSKVKKLRISHNARQMDPVSYGHLISLFKEAFNIHSLTFDSLDLCVLDIQPTDDICSAIIQYVNLARLQYLEISVTNMDQVQMLLERFKNLFSIKFIFLPWVDCGKLIAYAKALMPGCSVSQEHFAVSIWMDQRLETTNDCQCLTLSHLNEVE